MSLCCAGKRWVYLPNVLPYHIGNLDPAHLMQIQVQLHATGAEYGLLVSWSRARLAVFKVPYCHEFMVALARQMAVVVRKYIEPEAAPPLPQRFADLSPELQKLMTATYEKLGTVIASITQEPLGALL